LRASVQPKIGRKWREDPGQAFKSSINFNRRNDSRLSTPTDKTS